MTASNRTTHATAHTLTEAERIALGGHIPLGQLIPLAGYDRLPLDLLQNPAAREVELKRRVILRAQAGDFCLVVPAPKPWRGLMIHGVESIDIAAFARHHAGESECPAP